MASSVISSSPFLCKSAQQKDLGFPKSSQISVHRCQKRAISRKIVSVMAPQRSSSATGSVKTGMTMTEKILAKAAEKSQVVPGDNIWVNVDVLMTHDVCGPGAFGIFKREFGEKAKVWDPEKIVVIPDHYIFTTDKRANRNVDIMREHCREQNIKYFYDITDLGDFRANPDYKGVCHVALAQEGHCRPGEVLLGTDSHTCTAGAFGQFATGIGNTDAGFVLGTGKILLKMCSSFNFPHPTTTADDFENPYKVYWVDRSVALDLVGTHETPKTVREGYYGAYLSFFRSCGLIFPIPEPILEVLAELGLSLTQLLPNFLRHLVAFLVKAREEGLAFRRSEFRQLVLVKRNKQNPGTFLVSLRPGHHVIEDIPYRHEKWREQFFCFQDGSSIYG
ncbi:hypothetical protein F2Q69_00015812 [Brassica cretica]|uniref:Aconitase/3-isopropylmalate dehydratase large subunit alpha/beta/alpha domain-containing protein n=1 Tax=Brassica cretica TaxID=69181 RepID=A0A8S9R9Z4_BRACR|nr:hypothetical protein F2Q69_00015812 [Brassica cretica]